MVENQTDERTDSPAATPARRTTRTTATRTTASAGSTTKTKSTTGTAKPKTTRGTTAKKPAVGKTGTPTTATKTTARKTAGTTARSTSTATKRAGGGDDGGATAYAPMRRGTKLVIVESPSKAKTIAKYLGPGYRVTASMGHVRDLPKSKLGVDVDHEFAPQYLISKDKTQVVKDLKGSVQAAGQVYLATDPDREGEAIAWHLVEATGPDPSRVHRVVFHEITPGAVRDAMAHPRAIDMR